jgi:hypothetical protein
MAFLLSNRRAFAYLCPMNDQLSLTAAQLHHAADIKDKIVALEHELAAILGTNSSATPKRGRGRPRKTLIVGTTEMPKLKRRTMSAFARARIAAAAKRRWAKAKAAGKNSF